MNKNRLSNLIGLMTDREIDCAALVPGPNLYYMSGLKMHLSERITILLISQTGQVGLILPRLEEPHVKKTIKLDATLFMYRDEDGPSGAMSAAIRHFDLDGKRLAIEHQNMRVLEQSAILASTPVISFTKLEDLMTELRIIKDEAEISSMRTAIELTEQALQQTIDQIRPGMTEREVALIYHRAALDLQTDGVSFSPAVASGPNGGSPHSSPSDRVLSEGDMVTIDCGVYYNGYPGDITRNLAIGSIDSELEQIHEIVKQANEAGRDVSKPGIQAQEVDRASRKLIEDAGFSEYFIHRTGHGLGLEVHEPPYIMEGNEQLLRPGMTFTVEPGIYIPGLGGARVEDDMLVTPNGTESMTQMSRDLIRIG